MQDAPPLEERAERKLWESVSALVKAEGESLTEAVYRLSKTTASDAARIITMATGAIPLLASLLRSESDVPSRARSWAVVVLAKLANGTDVQSEPRREAILEALVASRPIIADLVTRQCEPHAPTGQRCAVPRVSSKLWACRLVSSLGFGNHRRQQRLHAAGVVRGLISALGHAPSAVLGAVTAWTAQARVVSAHSGTVAVANQEQRHAAALALGLFIERDDVKQQLEREHAALASIVSLVPVGKSSVCRAGAARLLGTFAAGNKHRQELLRSLGAVHTLTAQLEDIGMTPQHRALGITFALMHITQGDAASQTAVLAADGAARTLLELLSDWRCGSEGRAVLLHALVQLLVGGAWIFFFPKMRVSMAVSDSEGSLSACLCASTGCDGLPSDPSWPSSAHTP